jgi:hypothetical protein
MALRTALSVACLLSLSAAAAASASNPAAAAAAADAVAGPSITRRLQAALEHADSDAAVDQVGYSRLLFELPSGDVERRSVALLWLLPRLAPPFSAWNDTTTVPCKCTNGAAGRSPAHTQSHPEVVL